MQGLLFLLVLLVVCPAHFFSLQWMLIFLVFTAVPLLLIRSKFHQPKPPDTLPVVTLFSAMSAIIKLLRNRASARTILMDLLMGAAVCFSKEGMFLLTIGNSEFLFLYKTDAVESVFRSSTILKKGFPYQCLKDYLKEGLVISEGKKWHVRRKLLTPAFHFKILEDFTRVFNKESNMFVKRIDEMMQKQESVDIVPLAGACTMDIILETAMGKNAAQAQGKVYVEAFHTFCKCLSNRITLPWLWFDFVFHRTKDGKTSLKCLETMEKFTNRLIEEKIRERSERLMDIKKNEFPNAGSDIGSKPGRPLALLDLLVDFHIQDDSISLQDIAEEVQTFLFASHDTTKSALSWSLYLLGLHPDVQRKAQDEVDMVLGDDVDRIITSQDIRNLKYLHCVLKETLRLYPAVPFITRLAEEDVMISGHKIRKGTTILISIFQLHRNSEFFPNPEKFSPERFSPENVKNRHPFVYVPFSAGPRNCIGQRFATCELITLLATVLRPFNITSIEHRDKIKWEHNIVLLPGNGLHLTFTKRQNLRNYPD